MDGFQFWYFPWFPANSLLCIILRYTVYFAIEITYKTFKKTRITLSFATFFDRIHVLLHDTKSWTRFLLKNLQYLLITIWIKVYWFTMAVNHWNCASCQIFSSIIFTWNLKQYHRSFTKKSQELLACSLSYFRPRAVIEIQNFYKYFNQ